MSALLTAVVLAAVAGAAWLVVRRSDARFLALQTQLTDLARELGQTRAEIERMRKGTARTAKDGTGLRTEAITGALKQLNRAVTARVDLLAAWIARGASTEDRNALTRTLEEHDYFVEALAEGRITAVGLTQLFPGIERQPVEVGAIDPETGHANHVDMLYVCAIARHVKARQIFEFGTFLGRTTYHFALGDGVESVHTLDLDPAQPYPDGTKIGRAIRAVHVHGEQGRFFRDTPAARHIVQLHGDSRTFDYEPHRGRMDFIFVDGGHTYELVTNDTHHALTLLRPGGVVVWHDFAPKSRDVVRFAREFSRDRPLFWIEDTTLLVYLDR